MILPASDVNFFLSVFLFSGNSGFTWLNEESIRVLRYFARALMALFCNVLSAFRVLACKQSSGVNSIHPSFTVASHADDNQVVEDVKEDQVNPCLERLQRLEQLFTELKSKSAEIPIEKERVLMDSWERIKSIEFDLDKTKRVSFRFNFCGDSFNMIYLLLLTNIFGSGFSESFLK